jgi:aspartyl/asparaginyl beta-hydroxylase (cupin superfamily)
LGPWQCIATHWTTWKYHYGLNIPTSIQDKDNDIVLKVENRIDHWEEGKGFIFDDTFEHSVHNFTPEPRLIVLADVARDFPGKWRQMNIDFYKFISRLDHTKYVQLKLKNQIVPSSNCVETILTAVHMTATVFETIVIHCTSTRHETESKVKL